DERIPHLLRCPAAVRFLSCEPLLGPVNVRQALTYHRKPDEDFGSFGNVLADMQGVDWVIAGGESGPGARPCDATWIRSLVEQCRAAAVPVFVKQLGAHPWDSAGETRAGAYTSGGFRYGEFRVKGEILHLRDPKGGDPSEWPEDLRVREFPWPAEAQRIPPSNPTD
ncbi:MAG TPA: DUF5131 family protein, partial [Longimicrobiales bacterium]|nr:DUF5131 family protein [Longimicrobiales bacterium]